jgi:squalene monooxygenase
MAKGGAPCSGLADGSDAAANLYENNFPQKAASDAGVDDAEHSSTTTEASEELEVEMQGAPASSANYTAEHPEVIVVGAGTAGASLAIALARQGRKVLLLEKSMAQQDRIVGELLQPGGVRALQKLGLDECATEGCDSVRVDGYTIILPPGVSSQKPDGAETVLYYPEQDPEGALEQFGRGVRAAKHVAADSGAPRGRSFHNCRFVQRLRETALAEPNVSVVEGVVTQLVEEDERVVGVRYKLTVAAVADDDSTAAASDVTADRAVIEVRAPLTVVADGIWSGLRKCANTNKPVYISSFVGVLVTHPPMEAPVPHRNCGHVVLAQPSPILIYQISATETRVLVDVAGKMPSASTGALNDFLVQQAQYLPVDFKQPFLDAVARGGVKSMPNRALASSSQLKPGVSDYTTY